MNAMPVPPAANMGASTRVRGEVTSMSATAELDWTTLLHTWQELDVPEGWRAEITEWGITMTPPPHDMHNAIEDLVHKALVRTVPDDWAVLQKKGVAVPSLGRLYLPDIVVIPRTELSRDEKPQPAEPSRAPLVVEVTSPGNARYDRTQKRVAYATGGAPVYLLIDRCHPKGKRCTVYSDPRDGDYQRSVTSPFGEPVHLPAPFDLDIDTSRFE